MAKTFAQKQKRCGQRILNLLVVCLLCYLAASLLPKGFSFGAATIDLHQVLALIQQGNLKAAEIELKQAQTERPNDAAIYRLLGIVYQRESKFNEAEHAIDRAIALSGAKDPHLLFLLCQIKFALKQQNEALRLARQASDLAQNNPIAHYSLGRLLLDNGRFAAGVGELEKAHALAPGNAAVTTELIIGYLDQKNETRAGSLIANFLGRASYDDLIQAGARFGDAGRFGAAERAFELAVKAEPGSYDAQFNLAFADYRQGKLQEALTALDQVNSPSAQQQWDYHYLRGKIDAALHQNQAAANELLKALNLQPGNESLCSDAGLLFFRFEDFRKALNVYQTCAARLPDSASVQTGLGLTYFRLGKYNDAITTFRRVLAVRPQADAAREALGFLLYIEGNLSEAQTILEERADAHDADFYIYYLDALVLLRLHPTGLHEDALRLLDETLEKNPKFAPAYFEKARIWEDRNEPEQALANLQRAIQTDPRYAQPYYLMAQVDYKMGRGKEANQARLRFQALNTEWEGKEQERQVQDQLLQSLR